MNRNKEIIQKTFWIKNIPKVENRDFKQAKIIRPWSINMKLVWKLPFDPNKFILNRPYYRIPYNMVNSDRVKLTDKLLVNRPIMRRLTSIQYRRYWCFDHHENLFNTEKCEWFSNRTILNANDVLTKVIVLKLWELGVGCPRERNLAINSGKARESVYFFAGLKKCAQHIKN